MTGPVAWMGVPPALSAPASTVHTGKANAIIGSPGFYYDYATADFIAADTRARWQSGVGDYYDALGVLNGSTHSQTVVGTAPVNISGFTGDLVIIGNGRVAGVSIDGVDVTNSCLWTSAGSASCRDLPTTDSTKRVLVPMGTPGTSMIITAVSGTPTWNINALAAPTVAPMAMTGSYRAPDLFYLDLTSQAAMQAQPYWNYAPPWTSGPESFSTDAYGVKYRESSPGFLNGAATDQRLAPYIKWKIPPTTRAFFQWWEWIGPTVWDCFAERGMKQSGIGVVNNMGPLDTSLGFLMEHSGGGGGGGAPYPKNILNRNIFGQDYYTNNYANQGTYFTGSKSWCYKIPERWYCNEVEMLLNTVGVADGEARMWVNGHLIFDQRNFQWRKDSGTLLDAVFLQLFHGGQANWLSENCYYRQAMVAASTQYIGVNPIWSGL